MKEIKLILVLQFYFLNSEAVRIINLGVPSSYVLDVNFCRPLILDCDYEFRANDIGFVLKWYHNNHLIYQWIPPRKPSTFSVTKYHATPINIIDDPKYTYRAIQLQPHYNLSGDWMCSVSSYHTSDRKIKSMKVIVPEKSFELHHHESYFEMENFFLVICTVTNIYPEPEMSLTVGSNFKIISEMKSENDGKGFFNKSITARLDKNFLPSPSTINCILRVNGTNYIKKKYFIYYDYKFDKRFPTLYKKQIMDSHGCTIPICMLQIISALIMIIIIN